MTTTTQPIPLRELAREAAAQSAREAERTERERAEIERQNAIRTLQRALKRVLGIEIEPTEPEIEIDGLRFHAWQSQDAYTGPTLYLVRPCVDCGELDTRVTIHGLWHLGQVLAGAPAKRCYACEARRHDRPAEPVLDPQPAPTAADLLANAIEALLIERGLIGGAL